MGWIGRWIERRRIRALLADITALRGGTLEPELAAAAPEIARVLPRSSLDGRTRRMHARLVLAFARQLADGNRRLASRYWSANGRNVGMDVLQAEGRARAALLNVLAQRPPARRPMTETVAAVDALIVAQRNDPVDRDGYGLGTLHELRRDLAALAEEETGRRN